MFVTEEQLIVADSSGTDSFARLTIRYPLLCLLEDGDCRG